MVSTTISHKATFTVISDVRTDACDKLARMSLGDVLSRPSGEIKNTILERIDSIETTLAHIVPEVSSKLLAPIALFVYIMTIDWRADFAHHHPCGTFDVYVHDDRLQEKI